MGYPADMRSQKHPPPRTLAPCFRYPCSGVQAHSRNFYQVLGVDLYTATPESIRRNYRRLARLCHPDRHKGDEKAKQEFQAVQVLSDRWRRQEYDLWLLEYLDVVVITAQTGARKRSQRLSHSDSVVPSVQEDYLEVFKGFTLTVCGLGMDSKRLSPGNYESDLSPGPAAGVCSS